MGWKKKNSSFPIQVNAGDYIVTSDTAASQIITLTSGSLNKKPIAYDSFNRADGALGNAETGQAWQQLSGIWSIKSNQVTNSENTASRLVVIDLLQAGNYKVNAKIKNTNWTSAKYSSIVTRAVDVSNILAFSMSLTEICIWKRISGAWSKTATKPTSFENNRSYNVMVECRDNTLSLFIDGVLQVSYTLNGSDTTLFSNANTKYGFAADDNTSFFDDLKVESI